jgi:hypothetical protein
MAYTTEVGTRTVKAAEYAGAESLVTIKQDAILRDAERLVRKYGPPPDPITDEYESAASDAEMRVFDYLANTEGYLSSEAISGINSSYVDFEKVATIVRATLGDLAGTSVTSNGSANVGYVEYTRR